MIVGPIKFGGVRKTGLRLSGSYDLGGKDGYWGEISFDRLTGKNVKNNSSVKAMGGYYYKLINENDRRISVGLNSMLWHYNKDLSGYTLGQGVIIAHNNISHSHCPLITVNVLKIGHGKYLALSLGLIQKPMIADVIHYKISVQAINLILIP